MFRLPPIGQIKVLGQGTVKSMPQRELFPGDRSIREIGQEEIRKIGESDNPLSRSACRHWRDFCGRIFRRFTPFGQSGTGAPTSAEGPEGPIRSLLPNYVLQEVFKNLSDFEQYEGRSVCGQWKALLETAPFGINSQESPAVIIYGKKTWETRFGLKIEGEIPPVPKNIREISKALRTRMKGEGEAPACSLLLMPKGLSLFMLESLVRKPRMGNSTEIEDHTDFIFELFGNLEIEETYWVLITNSIIEGSGGLSYEDQMALIQRQAGAEYSAPFLLEALACGSMNHNKNGGLMIGPGLNALTRVQETDWDGDHVIVGSCNEGALCLHFDGYNEDALGTMVCKRYT